MTQNINKRQSSTGKVLKLVYFLIARLQYYYHRLLRRTLQGSVRYSTSSLFPFSEGEGTVLQSKAKLYTYHIGITSLLTTFGEYVFYQSFRKARAVFGSSPLERLGEVLCSAYSTATIICSTSGKRGLRFASIPFVGRFRGGRLAGFLLLIFISSCRLGKEYQRPEVELPQQFGAVSFADTSSIADIEWKKFFSDTTLQSLIEKGIQHNHDLLIAIKRIDIARQQVKQAKNLQLPEVDLRIAGSISRPSDNSLNGVSLKNFLGKSYVENYSASVNFSWEADIWGKIRGQKEVVLTEYLQSYEGTKAVQTQLVADIAQGFFNLLMLDKQVEISRKNLLLNDSFLIATRLLKDAGVVNALAVQQAESQKQSTALLIPQLEQQIAIQENALQVLTGQLPGKLSRKTLLDEINLSDNLSAGLPIAMLSRRPDVRSDELALQIATTRIGIAKANMYPALNITAGGGLESFKASNWFSIPNSLFGLAAGSIAQPIFKRRQLKTDYEIAKLEREQAVIKFRQSVLTATGEVADALVSVEKLKEQQQIASGQVDTLRNAVGNAQLLFKSDMANYLEVITAQGNALQAELNLASIRRQQLAAKVELYRSLGGGWK